MNREARQNKVLTFQFWTVLEILMIIVQNSSNQNDVGNRDLLKDDVSHAYLYILTTFHHLPKVPF